ncbi:MAG: HAD-IC family P-type ATPase, partial [Gemmatimonadota bacterium]
MAGAAAPRVSEGRDAPEPGTATAWHALPVDEVLREVEADAGGLGSEEAARRLERHGPNSLRPRKPVSAWAIFKHQFGSVVAWLLVVATAAAFAIGDTVEAVAIGVVLLINVIVGFWTEWRARIAVDALGRLQVQEAEVLRDGRRVKIDAAELVPGDVVVLSEGARVPADARLLEASELTIDEALLTGESMPVPKSVEPVAEERPGETSVGDRTSMVLKGTTVARGSGTAVVIATGTRTEIGKIGELVGSLEQAPTPIEERLDVLGRRLIWITLGVAILVIAVGLAGGRDPWLVVETGLALAIAAVPEGLPVVATITLAVGMWRMAKRNALVRRPSAVEALGSATVVCADKTGTLTSGRMTVTSVLAAEGRVDLEGESASSEGFRELVRSVVLANEGRLERADGEWEGVGDPTDVALLQLGANQGLERAELVSEAPEVARLPFSSARMLMATFHGQGGGPVEIHVKGATDRVLPLCDRRLGEDGEEPIDEALRDELRRGEEALAAEGLRVLTVATGTTDEDGAGSESALRGLTLLGFVGLMDPPAEGVEETIESFRAAGIRVLMITGDQPATARSIAERLGMLEG